MRTGSKVLRSAFGRVIPAGAGVLAVVLAGGVLSARPQYYAMFQSTYPDTNLPYGLTEGYSCSICHVALGGGGVRNPYGTAFETNGFNLPSIQGLDSDGDGLTNIQEIQRNLPPGWTDRPEPSDVVLYLLTPDTATPDANEDDFFDVADVIARAQVAPPDASTSQWTSLNELKRVVEAAR